MLPKEEYNQHFSFPKKEKLCSKKKIENIISIKKSCFCYPLKCYYLFSEITEDDTCNKIAISVPKRNFKSAVTRNRIKRLIREAYRLTNKQKLLPYTIEQSHKVDMLILYVGKEIPTYSLVEAKINLLFEQLKKIDFVK